MKIVRTSQDYDLLEEVVPVDLPEDTEDLDTIVGEPIEAVSPLESLTFSYFDPKTGLDTHAPFELEANDGTKMVVGYVKIDGIVPSDDMGALIERGMLDQVVSFANQDSKVNIDKGNLITDKLQSGVVSFLVSAPTDISKSSSVRISRIEKSALSKIDEESVQKVYNSFFEEFDIEGDITDFDINAANKKLFETVEKVAFNLTKQEKREVKKRIRDRLRQYSGTKLAYLG